ncbi:MAG: hypothetical protein H6718_09310 [Polyangiaceae bacterium]|nr:hypothetical protein [Myxococcales bacterium]MCB9585584.1 hypothetical protein [Polyangiaceae bacterium]MCB9606401.1 hypothetical protein [Polyangiaceae bacterium]
MLIILVVVIVLVYFAYNQKPSYYGVNPHPHSVSFDLLAEGVMWKVDFSTARIWRLANQSNVWIEFHMWRQDSQRWSLRLSDHAWYALRQELLTPNTVDGDSSLPISEVGEAPDWKPCPAELQQLLELRYQYLHSGYTHSTHYDAYAHWLQAPNQGYVDQPLGTGLAHGQAPTSENVYAPPRQ